MIYKTLKNHNDLENHISISSSNDIKEICKPLFERLDIGYFAFHRVYENGTIIRLSSYPEWSMHYIKQNYFNVVNLDHYCLFRHDYEYHFWDYYSKYDPASLPILRESYNDFRLRNGFVVFKNYGIYSDQYIFAKTDKNKITDNSVYLVMIQPIENFIKRFLNQASEIIAEAEKSRFVTGIIHSPLSLLEQEISSQNLREEYEDMTGLSLAGVHFSKREIECLSNLIEGMTSKQIARKLDLAPRTIDFYLENIKKKTGCRYRNELIAKNLLYKPS